MRFCFWVSVIGSLACAGAPGGATGSAIGIPACDQYITGMEACIPKLSPDAQATAQRLLDTAKRSWPVAARTDEGRKGLEQGCDEALSRAKKVFGPKGCDF